MAASIMDGFCCGLAIVIGLSQLHPFQIGHGSDKHWRSADKAETSVAPACFIACVRSHTDIFLTPFICRAGGSWC